MIIICVLLCLDDGFHMITKEKKRKKKETNDNMIKLYHEVIVTPINNYLPSFKLQVKIQLV
jgi:hypothetical protein